MAYADQGMSGNRIIGLIVAAIVHIALGYVLVTGLAYEAVKKAVERVTTVDIEEPPPPEEEPPPPPPDADLPPPPPVVAPPPPINIAPAPPPIRAQPTIPPPAPPVLRVPPPAPPPPPSQARGASPDGQARWQRRIIENYPSRAIREELEGRVGLRVSVTPDGRVGSCQVTNSSGHSILDDAACKDITRYGRFNPALNDAGNPTTGSWGTTIVYQLN